MVLKRPITFETTFDSFTAREIIGEGGAAFVYKATDSEGEQRAVKLLKSESTTREKRKRFKNEIDFCSRIEHKHIVPVLGHGVFSDGNNASIFYVMPHYSGSFRNLLEQGVRPERALEHFAQLLDGIEAAHLKNVVHRDLKPENILYDDKSEQLVIADFGIAMFQEDELFTAVETKETDRLANFRYAAPEQRHPGQSVDHRADIFTLGLILNEMFTREVISGTGYTTIASVEPEFAYLDEVVEQMIRQDPEGRFSSIRELRQRLNVQQKTFLSQQKVSELSGEVVPEGKIDDPLIANPPQIIDFDWSDGMLTLVLSCSVNAKWIESLRYSGMSGTLGIDHGGFYIGIETLDFSGSRVTTPAPAESDTIQEVVNLFKEQWLPNAKRAYENRLVQEQEESAERLRKELQQQVEREEARKRVLEEVKI